jgi:DNA-binding XRE family transcriptional regulator
MFKRRSKATKRKSNLQLEPLHKAPFRRQSPGMHEKDPESKKLVAALKNWMLKNNKSQSQIAELLGVDRRRVSKWFKDKAVPSLEHGIRIQKLIKEK